MHTSTLKAQPTPTVAKPTVVDDNEDDVDIDAI